MTALKILVSGNYRGGTMNTTMGLRKDQGGWGGRYRLSCE